MSTRTKTIIEIAMLSYCILWLVTAIIGPIDVDSAFDKENAQVAYTTPHGSFKSNQYDINIRMPFLPTWEERMYAEIHQYSRFRCRSRGIAIAPFLIIDEASWSHGSLSGWSGKRLILWLFGLKYYMPIKTYWAS